MLVALYYRLMFGMTTIGSGGWDEEGLSLCGNLG